MPLGVPLGADLSGDLVGNVKTEGRSELAVIGAGIVIRTNSDARTATAVIMMRERKREMARLELKGGRRDETGWEGWTISESLPWDKT